MGFINISATCSHLHSVVWEFLLEPYSQTIQKVELKCNKLNNIHATAVSIFIFYKYLFIWDILPILVFV